MKLLSENSLPSGAATALVAIVAVSTALMSAPVSAGHCGTKGYGHAPGKMNPYPAMPHGKRMMPHSHQQGMAMAGPSVIDVAERAGGFGTLLTAIDAAGLTGLLEGQGPFTLFAPTDAAFEKLPEGALQELLADKDKLTAILKYHVVPGRVPALGVLESRELKTASGQPLATNSIRVVRADIRARNGIIHVVDKVLLPSR